MIRVKMPSQPEFGTLNIEHRTSNIEHPTLEHSAPASPLGGERIKVRGGTSNIQHRTSNIQHPTSNLSPRRGYVFSVVGTSRCDVRAACSGATPSNANLARILVPPATTRARTA